MKERLTKKENVLIATMLFGLFFGAGNLIFPAYMGQLAGKICGRRSLASSLPA